MTAGYSLDWDVPKAVTFDDDAEEWNYEFDFKGDTVVLASLPDVWVWRFLDDTFKHLTLPHTTPPLVSVG